MIDGDGTDNNADLVETTPTDAVDFEALAREQAEFEVNLRLEEEARVAEIARKEHASGGLKERDELIKKNRELDDSVVGGLSRKGLEEDQKSLATLDTAIKTQNEELETLQVKLAEADASIEKVNILVTGGAPMAPKTQETLEMFQRDKEETESKIKQKTSEIEASTQSREQLSAQLDERHAPIKETEKIEDRMREIEGDPVKVEGKWKVTEGENGIMNEMLDLAEREKDIREVYAKNGVYQILEAGRRDEKPTEAQKQFAQDVLQQYLDEEITRRGWDDLEPEERLKNIQALTTGMIQGMQYPPYESGHGHKENEISQLKQWGSPAIDKLHGKAIKTLLGSGYGSPSNALFDLAYASSMEHDEKGEPMHLFDLESASGLPEERRYTFDRKDLRSDVKAFDGLRQDILAHAGTFSRLKVMANKQQYSSSKIPTIYNDRGDWKPQMGMEQDLSKLGINVSPKGIEPKEWMGNRGEHRVEYDKDRRRAEAYEKDNVGLIDRANSENIERQRQELAQKEKALAELEEKIKRFNELEAEKQTIIDQHGMSHNYSSAPETGEIERLRKTIEARNNQRNELSRATPGFFQNKGKFSDSIDAEKKELDDANGETVKKIEEIQTRPNKRKIRLEEIDREMKELTGQRQSPRVFGLEDSADRLKQEIERLRRTVGETTE